MEDVSPALSTVPFRNFAAFLDACERAGAESEPLREARSFFARQSRGRAGASERRAEGGRAAPPLHLHVSENPVGAAHLAAVLDSVSSLAEGDEGEDGGAAASWRAGKATRERLGRRLASAATCVLPCKPVVHAPRGRRARSGSPPDRDDSSGQGAGERIAGPGAVAPGDDGALEARPGGGGDALLALRPAPDSGEPARSGRAARRRKRAGATPSRTGEGSATARAWFEAVTVRGEFAEDSSALVALAAMAASPDQPAPLGELLASATEVLRRHPLRGLKGRLVVTVVMLVADGAGAPRRKETAEASTPWMSPERLWRLVEGTPLSAGLPASVVAGDGAPALALGPLAAWLGDLLVAAQDPARALPHLTPDLTVELSTAAEAAAFLRGFLIVRPRAVEPGRASRPPSKREEDPRLVFTMEHLEEGREVSLWPALHRLMARHGTQLEDFLGADRSTFDWLVSHLQREVYRKFRSFDPARAPQGYFERLAARLFFGALYQAKLPASSPRRDAASHLPEVSVGTQAQNVQASKISGAALERLWRQEGKLLPEHQALLRLLSGQSLHAYVLSTLRGELALASWDRSRGGFEPEPEEPAAMDDGAGSSFWRLAQERWEDRQRPAAAPRREVRAEGPYVPEGDVVQYCRDWQCFEWGHGPFARAAFPAEIEALSRLAEATDLGRLCRERLDESQPRQGAGAEDPAGQRRSRPERLAALLARKGGSTRLVDLTRAELKELAHALGLSTNRPASALDALYVVALLYPDGHSEPRRTATRRAKGETDEPDRRSDGAARRPARRGRQRDPRDRRADAD